MKFESELILSSFKVCSMQAPQIGNRVFWGFIPVLATFLIFFALRVYDHYLFVSVVQEFTIIISCAIFLLSWNSRRFLEKNYLVFFGIAYLFVGLFDFLQVLVYKGAISLDNWDENLAAIYWAYGRIFQGIPFLAIPIILDRRIRSYVVFAAFGCAFLLLSASPLLLKPYLEPTSVENALTSFKTLSEIVISLIFMASIGILFMYRDRFQRGSWLLLEGSAVCFTGSELNLSAGFVNVGFADLLGRFLMVVGYYLLYKAVVSKGLQKPYELLFQDLKREQQSLERERNFVSAILDTAGSLVIVLDTHGCIVRFNGECERLTGYSACEVMGKPFWDLLSPTEQVPTVKEAFSNVLAGNVPNRHESDWLTRSGDSRLIAWRLTALRDEHGRTEHVIGAGIDITEARRAEQETLRAKEEWEATFHAVPDLIMILDGQHRILRANRAMAEKVGRTPEELVGKKCHEIVHGSSTPIPFCVHTELMCDGKEHTREVVESRINAVLLVSVSPLKDLGGKLIGSVHVARDVSERARREAMLQNALSELERSNTELQQFAYVASHDLQEPLRMVSSYVRLLERRYKGRLDTDADDFIQFAVDGAQRMQRLIDDLLRYSRVGTHGREFSHVDCGVLVNQVLANLKVSIEESGAQILLGALPTVKGDATQLTQLFQNVIENAIKFRNNEPPEIEISAEKADDSWRFSLADNGIGIDPQYHERVFSIFQRLHGRDRYPGTGIGLAICKKIVERHAGRIWIQSEEGAGTSFFFTIPYEG
jgi:PAS domain S-box-containing protein